VSTPIIQGEIDFGGQMVIGVVTSRFNIEITEELERGCLARLHEAGVQADQIARVRVPGAYEIPLAARWLLEQGVAGVIALGAVIRGETAHFDYVCQSVERGLTTLQLDSGRPVVFGVLTTDTEEQAKDRIGGSHGHKGREAAEVALEMLSLEIKLSQLNPPNKKEFLDEFS
jgi:6,7-dimethyl-8-ribityllumazine synthase